MSTVLIVIHLMVVLAMIGLVLLQRSEGGALGIGGGGGGGNFLSARGAGNVLTRTTAILAAVFFATSIGLTLLARWDSRPSDILDRLPEQTGPAVPVGDGTGPQAPTSGGVLDALRPEAPGPQTPPEAATPEPTVPEAPAPTTAPAAEAPASAPVPTTPPVSEPAPAIDTAPAEPPAAATPPASAPPVEPPAPGTAP